MRTFLLLTFAIITFSCSNREKSNTPNKVAALQNLPKKQEEKITALDENVHYLGFINTFYFSNKNEAYIELHFTKDKITDQEYAKLEKLADSLIYQDDESSRHKFPASLAAKHFDLRGLSKLAIYDNNNIFFCNAEFVRVEYLSQPISSYFIAVYKTEKKIKLGNYYAVSNFEKSFETPNYTITKDTLVTQKMLARLNANKPYGALKNNGTHILFNQSDTLSIVNSEDAAHIILHNGEKFKTLYKSSETENINEVMVIPLMKNKLPYLLTHNSVPDSDVTWNQLLHYDGSKYINTNKQRIE